jgi:hypothetical protein
MRIAMLAIKEAGDTQYSAYILGVPVTAVGLDHPLHHCGMISATALIRWPWFCQQPIAMEAPRRAFNNKRWLDREIDRNSIIVFLPDGADVGNIFTLAPEGVSTVDSEVDASSPIMKVEQFFACRSGDHAGQRPIFFGALLSVVKRLECECVVGVY